MKKIKSIIFTKIKASIFLIVIVALSFFSLHLVIYSIEEELMNKDASSKEFTDKLKIFGAYSDIYINDFPGSSNNWAWATTQPWFGGGSGTSIDPYVIDGHIFNVSAPGIPCFSISHSRKYFIMSNCIIRESGHILWGLYLDNTTNGVISNNQFYNNGMGIYLYNCSKITINGNTIYKNFGFGIQIGSYCHHNIISGNIIHNNSQYGIYLDNCDFNNLIGNSVYNHSDSEIYLKSSSNNALTSNSIYDSKVHGIYCDESNENTIEQNTINNNMQNGIFLLDSLYNSLEGNTISYNTENGIELDGSLYNLLSDNSIFDNLLHGINIIADLGSEYSDSNNITLNKIYHNNESGINLDDEVYSNDIWDNYIYDNTIHGINLFDCGFGKIYKNWIYDNGEKGLLISSNSNDNSFYENVFVGNKKHAVDDGLDNVWNSTTIGNFWDNHTGPDTSPHDGIVDIQYNISGSGGSIDYLPIAEDGAPRINILSPIAGDLFKETAPDFALTITEDYLASRWYKINNSATNYPFTGLSGTIVQSSWDALSDGNVTLTFYARDLPGHIGSKEVIIQKDSQAPVIIINSPSSGEEFGTTPPTFNITVTDPNLNSTWYKLDGNITILGNILVWTIPQEIWDTLPEGSATITIYANDTLGHTSSQAITITKNIPSRGIGLDYFTTGILITLISTLSIVIVITKMYHKKQLT